MAKFKEMKVFDCQDMPTAVKQAFFKTTSDISKDVHVLWKVEGGPDDDDGDGLIDLGGDSEEAHIVDAWLMSEGAASGEKVLIDYWW